MHSAPLPGSVINLRSTTWKVLGTNILKRGFREVHCQGISGIIRGKEARFVWDLEDVLTQQLSLVPDGLQGLLIQSLWSLISPNSDDNPSPPYSWPAAIDDLFSTYQLKKALQDQVRFWSPTMWVWAKHLKLGWSRQSWHCRIGRHYAGHADTIQKNGTFLFRLAWIVPQ